MEVSGAHSTTDRKSQLKMYCGRLKIASGNKWCESDLRTGNVYTSSFEEVQRIVNWKREAVRLGDSSNAVSEERNAQDRSLMHTWRGVGGAQDGIFPPENEALCQPSIGNFLRGKITKLCTMLKRVNGHLLVQENVLFIIINLNLFSTLSEPPDSAPVSR